jgi:cytochrome c-type biogenesis protein CcmE
MMIAIIIVVASLIAAASIIFITNVDAAMKVEKLNNFYTINQTTRQPMFTIVGMFTNNGTEKEEEVDISLAMFDKNEDIVGVSFLYNYDVKVNDTIPFKFRINAHTIENGNFSAITKYTVIAE